MWETSEDRLKRLIKEEKAQSSLSTLEKTAPEHFSKTVGNQRKTAEIKNKATLLPSLNSFIHKPMSVAT